MATYTFKNTRSGKIEEHTFPMSEYDKFKADNPHLERYITSADVPRTVTGVNNKPDNGFRDVLKTIKKGSPRSTVNTF